MSILIQYLIGCLFAVVLGAGVYVVTRDMAESTPPSFMVLVCEDTRGEPKTIGISSRLWMSQGVYWMRDKHGQIQSYRPSSYSWCATFDLQDAKAQGLVK